MSTAGGFGDADPNSGTATFEVIEVLRGQESLAGVKEINVVYFGETDRERVFLIMGLGAEKPDWTTPLPLSHGGGGVRPQAAQRAGVRRRPAGVLSGIPGARRPAAGAGCLRRVRPRAVRGGPGTGPADAPRSAREVDRRPGDQSQPAAAVLDDARRVRQQGRPAAVGIDDRVGLRRDGAVPGSSGDRRAGDGWPAHLAAFGSKPCSKRSGARSWGSTRSWPVT